MGESANNYPLSTEQNDSIPLDIAKPSRVYLLGSDVTGVTLTLTQDDNNIFAVSADVLTFISINPEIDNYVDLNLSGVNEGVYVITPQYTHMLALPKTVKVFSVETNALKRIIMQEIVRWAALGGQSVSYEVS